MSTFDIAFDRLMKLEGGYSNNKNDHGGATNFGISLRFLKGIDLGEADVNHDGEITAEDIQNLTIDEAKDIYLTHFWNQYHLDQISSSPIACKLFDLFVNMSNRSAGRIAQRAARACGHPVSEDGILGPGSISAINACDEHLYLTALKSESAGFYRLIVAKNPTQKVFEKGWLNRAYSD